MPSTTSQDLLHISNMSSCSDVGRMKEGQTWSVRAEYNFSKHTGMIQADGTKEAIVGTAILYVSQKNEEDAVVS